MPTDNDDGERVLFLLTPPEDLWTDWKRDTPRHIDLQNRLHRLLHYDLNNDLDGLVASAVEIEDDDESVPVQMMRIRHRCMSGIQDARANDADDAAEALKEIQEVASGILEG